MRGCSRNTASGRRNLVGHEVNAQLLAARVELANFLAGQRAPALPDGSVMAVGERVLGIELKFG